MAREKKIKSEFGDFQTPRSLASEVCSFIRQTGFSPASVIEPTCGRGAFLLAALEAFPTATHFIGVDKEAAHVEEARRATSAVGQGKIIRIVEGDFFETNWPSIVATLPKPLLILGNPPWVTNSTLGSLGSGNTPPKANEDNLRGIDALTGKSNFDISEWMLRRSVEWLIDTPGMLAVLCKTAVARKVLHYAWSHGIRVSCAEVRRIDAQLHFGASVDACLLAVRFERAALSTECASYSSLWAKAPETLFGLRDGRLVADVRLYDRWKHLRAPGLSGWRSGIKHDCSEVFELLQTNGEYTNAAGVRVDVEPEVLFPLLKSSDLARKRGPRKWLLVPQRTMRTVPEDLRRLAPKAWAYLCSHETRLAKRASSIYRKRPRFSIFGVGEYSFSPWKVAIPGLYKSLDFVKVSPFQGCPVVFDDTCYFFSCESEHECNVLYEIVRSGPAQEFWSALIFWDAKRPITAETLNLLDLAALASLLDIEPDMRRILQDRQRVPYTQGAIQPLLFRDDFDDYISSADSAVDHIAAEQQRTARTVVHRG